MLRIVFLGTPRFALPSLTALLDAHTVALVVTQPDRPAGRGRALAAPPVAALARERGLRLLQPARLRDPAVVAEIGATAPQAIVTVAYGRIIPDAVLAIPPLGCLNVHPSLLPKYRGASPIQAAILHGDEATGISILYQTAALDAGPLILQREVPIGPDDTAGALEDRLAAVGADALLEALAWVEAGRAPRVPQDESQATYVGKLTKESGRIDWTQPADRIVLQVRAMDPWPTAYTVRAGRELKIWRAEAVPGEGGPPGAVAAITPRGFAVHTGRGLLHALEVQPEGGRRMAAAAYVRGRPLATGERLGGLAAAAP